MSKDNAKNNYSSTNYAKIIIKFLIKRNEKMKVKKKHLQANGFKGFKKTFVNNGVYGLEKLSRNHSIFSFVSSWKNSSWKNKFRFKGFRFKSKAWILNLHTNKQSKNILKLTNYIKNNN